MNMQMPSPQPVRVGRVTSALYIARLEIGRINARRMLRKRFGPFVLAPVPIFNSFAKAFALVSGERFNREMLGNPDVW